MILLLFLGALLIGCANPYDRCRHPGLSDREFTLCVNQVNSDLDYMERSIDRMGTRRR